MDDPSPPRCDPLTARHVSRRLVLAWVLCVLFGAMLAYKVLHRGELAETALFYVGLPALIALAVVLTARPRHPVGAALAVTTVGLALAGPLLNEGMVCLLMAAPLFYGIAALVGGCVGALRRRSEDGRSGYSLVLALPVIAVACLEGVGDVEYLPRDAQAEAQAVVDTEPQDLAAALAAAPDYPSPDSAFLRVVPFPEPVSATGTGLEVGDARIVEFTARTTLRPGSEPEARTMRLEVAESDVQTDEGRVVFAVTEDTTLSNWLELHRAEVTWQRTAQGTRVHWTLDYDRTFDPSWYWGPLQQYGMNRAAEYLLNTFR